MCIFCDLPPNIYLALSLNLSLDSLSLHSMESSPNRLYSLIIEKCYHVLPYTRYPELPKYIQRPTSTTL